MKSSWPKKLTIVFPLYNESKRLVHYFPRIKKMYEKNKQWQFIFVNDGSTDLTKKILTEKIKFFKRMRLISYSQNQGKGYALKKGVKKVKTNLVLLTDIDLSTPIAELKTFYSFTAKGADIVIGTRKTRGATIVKRQKLIREWMGKQFTNLANIFLGCHITDYTCGFKLFKTNVAQKLFCLQKIHRWGFDAEILFLAKKFDDKIVEVPVVWTNDSLTRVELIKDVIKTFWDLLMIRWHDYKKDYK